MNYSKENNRKNIKENSSNKTKMKSKSNLIFSKIIIALILIIGFAIIGGAVGIYLAILRNTPALPSITPSIYSSEIIIEDTGEVYTTLDASQKRIHATLDEIPDNLEHAFIAIEDSRFYEHNGIDIKGSIRSVYQTIFKGNSQGGSTITQQLIKNARGLLRNNTISKLQEQYLAVTYEKDLTEELGSKKAAKDYILEAYLNTIAMGHGLNGVQTASNYYFGKDVSEITLVESAVLASITQSPARHAPDDYPDNNAVRANTTLSYMLEQGFITDEEYLEAKYELDNEVYDRINQSRKVIEEETSAYSYYTDQVILSVVNDLMEIGYSSYNAYNLVYDGGLKIHIPIDLTVQNILEETYKDDSFFPENHFKVQYTYIYSVENELTGEVRHLDEMKYLDSFDEIEPFKEQVRAETLGVNDKIIAERDESIVQPQSSFVIIDQSTGKVRGLVGGRGEKTLNLSFNRATQALRSPGSVFKIVSVYAPGIDLGLFYPGYIIDDAPTVPDSKGKQFENWYQGYEGLTTIRRAVYRSINTVAVRGMQQIGINTSIEYLKNFGYTSIVEEGSRNDMGLSTALGGLTDGVTNLEMTASFATIANSGNYIEPQFYSIVYDNNGEILLENTPETRKVLSDDAAYLVTDMMQDVITEPSGTGGAANLYSISMPVAGKTGTTSDNYDLAFAGYTPYYTGGVMYGYDKPRSISPTNNGHRTHTKIWQHIMTEIHTAKNLEPTSFTKPSTIIHLNNICLDSGLLANEYCSHDPRGSRVTSEIFSSSNLPTDYCTIHDVARIDTSTGLLANDFCPPELVSEVIGLNKINNYYNVYSYVPNYFSVVADAKYELPVDYCTTHDHNSLIIIPDTDENTIDNEIIITDDDHSLPQGQVDENNLPPQVYYEDEDGNPIPQPIEENNNNNNVEIEIPEPVVPDEIPDFNDDDLIIP